MKRHQSDFAQFVIATALNAEGGAPSRVIVLPAPEPDGLIHGLDGRTWPAITNGQLFVAQLNNSKRDLFIDYGHESENQYDDAMRHKAVAAAWLSDWKQETNGAITAAAEWTTQGRAAVDGREYRYLSPALKVNSETGEIVAFGRPGLTNIANFPQTQLNAEEANPDKETGADTMPKQIEITTALCAAISATDENAVTAAGVVDHINSQADTITQLNAEIERLKDPANFRPAADVENLETQLNAAQDKLKGFRDQEIKALIEGAVADGKIAPASVGHYTALCASDEGLKQVQGIIGTAITATPNADGKPAGEVDDEDTDLNASNEAIANEFGVSAEAAAAARQSLFPN